MNTLVTVLHTENPNVPNHWIVGGVVLAILLSLMVALLIFGAGREHS